MCGGATDASRGRQFLKGSIPACAGEPTSAVTADQLQSRQGVYPRVCGGAALDLVDRVRPCSVGLSPRVRGSRIDAATILELCVMGLSPRVRGSLLSLT